MANSNAQTGGAVRSMTGFASLAGTTADQDWVWEIKSVNGRGLDLRLRVPDRITGLEAEVRKRAAAKMARGNVSINLRVSMPEDVVGAGLDPAGLQAAIETLLEIQKAADAGGLDVVPVSAADIASMRGVIETSTPDPDTATLKTELLAAFEAVVSDFNTSRETEGKALANVLAKQLEDVSRLTGLAREEAAKRPDAQRDSMQRALAKIQDEATAVDEARLAQELALLAIKSDVTEEFDRLETHIETARGLLESGGPVGRKLDFLMQEFNREANTLCSKAQAAQLTAIGLDMKAVIDQMREQVQNIE